MGLEDIIREKHSGDNEHLDFIFSEEKKIIVTAPAGCGKTTAMVSKIAWELGKGTISSNKKDKKRENNDNKQQSNQQYRMTYQSQQIDNSYAMQMAQDISSYRYGKHMTGFVNY